jgi:hypothetical protein
MAVSARQLERQEDPNGFLSLSLVLYQQAIRYLIPHLGSRSTAVIATCVVLCVLEMLSCSPLDWEHHLDGCAVLLQAVQINGFSKGLEGALFWCFARMDVCGGLISSKETLIPVSSWTATDLQSSVQLFKSDIFHYESHAKYSVFLTAHVVKLLSSRHMMASHHHGSVFGPSKPSDEDFDAKWLELWGLLEDWNSYRPAEMYPAFTRHSSPFPTILFTTPSAISGMAHHVSCRMGKPSLRC